jgi:hypothetical protein
MRIIYRAASIIDANLVKAALESESIPTYVSGEYLTGGVGQLPTSDLVHVLVSDSDVERAQPIADAIDAALSEPPVSDAEFEMPSIEPARR